MCGIVARVQTCAALSKNIFSFRGGKSWTLMGNRKVLENCAAHLFLILPPGGVQGLDKSRRMTNKNSIASGSYDHTQHGEPDV